MRRSLYPATVRRLVEALGLDIAARATLLASAQSGESAGGPAQVELIPMSTARDRVGVREPDLPTGTVTFLFTDIGRARAQGHQANPRV